MSRSYGGLAFTSAVKAAQQAAGSRRFGRRSDTPVSELGDVPADPLTDDERTYLAARDGFFLATTSETGWPYVQYRGGPPGFLKVLDDHTIAWADYRGNRQYVSVGNLSGDVRVALIVMDFPNQQRLKIFGRARLAESDPDLIAAVTDPSYDAIVERAVVVSVAAYDWNCPQHIVPRHSTAEIEPVISPLRHQLDACQAENRRLRGGGEVS
jgi:predicted pyridoxine 5'-phosphate oxidase superfamily flavin-nucleotide-binding protein